MRAYLFFRYESDLDERYIMICFAQVIGSVIGMSGCLFLVYMVRFVPGYFILLTVFCQLLEFCLLGTVLTVKVLSVFFWQRIVL